MNGGSGWKGSDGIRGKYHVTPVTRGELCWMHVTGLDSLERGIWSPQGKVGRKPG